MKWSTLLPPGMSGTPRPAAQVAPCAAWRRRGGGGGRVAEHDVVGGAAGLEAVVLRCDVDPAVAVDLGGGQWRGTYPGDCVGRVGRDLHGGVPGGAAVVGAEGPDAAK